MHLLHKRPAYLLHLLWLGCLAVCAATAWLALQQPWLGVKLAAVDGKVRVLEDVTQQIPLGAEVRRLEATGATIELLPLDFTENLDSFTSYAEKDAFFAKQSALDEMLHSSTASLVWADVNNVENTTSITPRPRSLASLSAMFWFTLFVVSMAFVISSWVFLMRPNDWGSRMFALSGAMLLIGGITGALIAERALALDGMWFSLLDNVNSLAGQSMGGAILALFLCFPRQLVAPRTLWWIAALTFPLWLANILHLLPDATEPLLVIFAQMFLAFIFAAVQWRHTRGQAIERAALRWFALSVLLGCSLFILTNVLPQILRVPALMPMGYAIGFFLIMYVGIALGLRRYRLFDIDEWAYRVLLWVAGATSVIALDGLLIFTGVTEGASLGISLLLCGWLYFPFRQWLWQRIVNKQAPNFESLLPEISTIAFIVSATEQQQRWEALLRRIFDPLEINVVGGSSGEGGLREEGLSMLVPGCGNVPVYALRYAGRGSRLFSTRDAVFAASLSHLLEQIMSGRSSYEHGVAQERLRIGRDLHDNIGARLLKLIHHLRGTPNAEVARDAMKDLRTAIAAMDGQPVPLLNALADWRAEAGSRCEVAGCRLYWQQSETLPAVELQPRVKATLESVLREIITNALKHALPQNVHVEVTATDMRLSVKVDNDGDVADPLTWKDGYGLRNMRGRLEELGGGLSIATDADKVRLTVEVMLK